MRWPFFAIVCFVAILFASGCNNVPTLPLPPPVASVSSPNAQGLVLVQGQVNPNAYVNVFNERAEAGVITKADKDGKFSAKLEGRVGDVISVWQEIDDETGERTDVLVRAQN